MVAAKQSDPATIARARAPIAEPEHRGQSPRRLLRSTYEGRGDPATAVGEAPARVGARDATLYCAVVLAALAVLALTAVQETRARSP